jgi:hypothetical protein
LERSFDHKRLGRGQDGEERRTATAKGGSIISRVGVGLGGRRLIVIYCGSNILLSLLGTTEVRGIIGPLGVIGVVVSIVPVWVPVRECQLTKECAWTEGRRAK